MLFVQNVGKDISQLQLRMSLYDSAHKQFFGHMWNGPVIDLKHGSKLAYNQVHLHYSIMSH